MDRTTDGSQSFMESIGEMVQRLERVERIVTLIAGPVLPLKGLLTLSYFEKYLDDRSSASYDTDPEKPWRKGAYAEYTHKTANIVLKLPNQWDCADGTKLLEALLTIAALEGRMPSRVLVDIQPDVFSAVDALATVVENET